jgi:hypothetical protein
VVVLAQGHGGITLFRLARFSGGGVRGYRLRHGRKTFRLIIYDQSILRQGGTVRRVAGGDRKGRDLRGSRAGIMLLNRGRRWYKSRLETEIAKRETGKYFALLGTEPRK